MDAFHLLEERLLLKSGGVRPTISLSEEQVAAAETALGVQFPPSYRRLLLSFRQGQMPGDVYWVDGDGSLDEWLDIVKNNQPGWHPSFLLAIVTYGNGDESCFDLRRRDEDGEYPIVFYDHEIGRSGGTEFTTEASNLAELLLGFTP